MNTLQNKLETLPEHERIWVKQLLHYIEQSTRRTDLSASQMAKRFQMSERQFYRRVKQSLSLTPNQLIRTIKMQKAKEFIEIGTYATVAELAYNLGYNQPEYFSNLFQSTFGKRPSHYMKNFSPQSKIPPPQNGR